MCSITGTANGSVVLPNDPTGNRRFVAIPIRDGNPQAIRSWLDENRTQLWAEAWHRARAGELCWFPHELQTAQEQINETVRSSDTLLEDAFRTWIENQLNTLPTTETFHLHHAVEGCGMLRNGETASGLPQAQVRRIARVASRFGCRQAVQSFHEDGKRKQRRVWLLPNSIDNITP